MQGQARECMRTKAGATCTGKRFMLIQTRHKVPESKNDGGRGKTQENNPGTRPGWGGGVVLDDRLCLDRQARLAGGKGLDDEKEPCATHGLLLFAEKRTCDSRSWVGLGGGGRGIVTPGKGMSVCAWEAQCRHGIQNPDRRVMGFVAEAEVHMSIGLPYLASSRLSGHTLSLSRLTWLHTLTSRGKQYPRSIRGRARLQRRL